MWKRSIHWVLLIGVLALIPGGVCSAFNPLADPALIGWWTCDEGSGETVADSSENHNNGTFVNGTSAWVEGIHGKAIELRGPTLIEIPAINQTLSEATMAGWMKPYGAQPEWASFIMTRGSATGFNVLADFRGPRENGFVTSATLFRDGSAGSRKGPFISQFLLKDVPYGVQTISQRNKTRPAGDDRMCTSAEWLNIQDGQPPAQPEAFDPVRRYIRNGRDLAELVHHDVPLQAALNAALLIIAPGQGDDDTDPKAAPLVHDENNPYRLNGGYTQQEAFATFGNGDALDLIGRIVNLALRGAWAQKWLVHRRLRPEACGGGIHAQKTGAAYPMWTQMMQSPVLSWVYDRNNLLNGSSGGTYLLSQAYPGGSPLHPAYPSGHSTYIGAAVTMMKALFKDRAVVDPVQPDASGTSLVPYQGPTLYLFDELDKLASNIGLGRLFAGVHYRSDHEQAVRLGELIALRVLQDMTRLYNETFPGFMVRTFGGETLTITKNGPDLPNHVSAILGFTLINSLAEQPVASHDPLLNGSTFQGSSRTIRANTYPSNVGSVRFVHEHNGVQRVFTDSSAPYALAGDVNGNYHHVVFGSGEHVLTATPFSGAGASGISGVPLTIRFTVQA